MKQCVFKDASRACLYHFSPATKANLQSRIGKSNQPFIEADVSHCRDIHAALAELGKLLQFPIWYGANYDALHDCLSDPDWPFGKGVILQISGLESLRSGDPESFSTLVNVLQSATENRIGTKQPLWILLDTPARGIPTLPDA